MEKKTLPMLSMIFKDTKERIAALKTAQMRAEENKLLGQKDILRARVMQAEQSLITSTLLFFKYLEESKIKF